MLAAVAAVRAALGERPILAVIAAHFGRTCVVRVAARARPVTHRRQKVEPNKVFVQVNAK